jgi:glycosyltransferase involved in cell wall biosynthesis
LIPTYNRADYLGQAVASALAQDYPNLEIIVHDDASTDGTQAVLRPFRRDPRLRVITTRSNHGMLGGWNYIVKKATGKYLKFLASDDLLAPRAVTELVAALESHPEAALATCRRRFIDENGRVTRTMGFAAQSCVVSGRAHAHWILTTLRENKIGEPTAVLYRRRDVARAGAYDPTFSQFADFEYWLRLLACGDIVYVHKPLCSFRVHAGSNTSAAIRDGRFITEIFALIKKYYVPAGASAKEGKDPIFVKAFSLTDRDRAHVTRVKTLDTLKNIKDLFAHGEMAMARRYFSRLQKEVPLDYMTRATIQFLLAR